MKVHPRQIVSVVKHIYQNWANGCLCLICRSVDNQENITVVRRQNTDGKSKESKAAQVGE